MSRAERERRQVATERWPRLCAFISDELQNEFFFKRADFNAVMLDKVDQLSLSDKKLVATECGDFIEYFAGRYDDIYMVLDGLGANVPPKKIPYEGEAQQQGVVRVKLIYSELARPIRKEEPTWQK